MQVSVAALDDPHGRPLLLSRFAARYTEPGYLLFVRDQAVVAQRIDLRTLTATGRVIPLAEQARVQGEISGIPPVDAAREGTLVYDPVDRRPTSVAWVGRDGRLLETVMQHPSTLTGNALSHDGSRLAAVDDSDNGGVLWVLDVVRGTEVRLSPSDRTEVIQPAWAADDRRIVIHTRGGEDKGRIVALDASSGADQVELALNGRWILPTSIAQDGTIVLAEMAAGGQFDIVTLAPGREDQTRPYLVTPADESNGSVSPDGRFLAYSSDGSGRRELYIDGFPEHREAIRVSTDGAGESAWWRADGREIYFISGSKKALMACDVRTSPTLEIGRPHVLFELSDDLRGIAPAPRGDRFLVLRPVGARPLSLIVVQNWAAQLDRQD